MTPDKPYRAVRFDGIAGRRSPFASYAAAEEFLGDEPGFIEEWIPGIGWCYATEPEPEEADE